ncbi:MAG: dienelactone hydrolase family protein, partial [Verrucomicrobiota bacterium]
LMDGAYAFIDRKTEEAISKRGFNWAPELESIESFVDSLEPNRERLAKMIGAIDELAAPEMEILSRAEVGTSGIVPESVIAETATYTIYEVRWPVLKSGVIAEGLYVEPKNGSLENPAPALVVMPDASETPEALIGLTETLPSEARMAARLAEAGFRLIIPTTVSTAPFTGHPTPDPKIQQSDQSYREWIHRQAFHMGRHVIGYEVQTARAAAIWLKSQSLGAKVGVAGFGEGGLVAMYAAAIDPRIDACLVSGYFGPRETLHQEPIYRNLHGFLTEFGDAEIAALIWPRTLVVEHLDPAPTDEPDHKGICPEFTFDQVEQEFQRIGSYFRSDSAPEEFILAQAKGQTRCDYPALAAFTHLIKHQVEISRMPPLTFYIDRRSNPAATIEQRHHRIFQSMEDHVQSLIDSSATLRRKQFIEKVEPQLEFGKSQGPVLPFKFLTESLTFREKFRADFLGEFIEPLAELNPRSRKRFETDQWIAYDVVLDVYPEMFAWGILTLPKDLKPGETRPVVVCQHGRDGLPIHMLNDEKASCNRLAARLADQGYITFSPHNLYRGEDRFRHLARKANGIGGNLWSFILPSHRQILAWLKEQPWTDPDKIAFYGLSYGGKTAMRIPAVLDDYSVVVCSGDFNQMTRKIADPDAPNSFMKTREWEVFEWDLGNHFDYAEMAALIYPRPFMVERGHHDSVSRDHWVAHEYAKVRWLYSQLGEADKTGITFFQGGHEIRADETLKFIEKHLGGVK